MNLKTYYQKRANEYDLVYQKPERQNDLKRLHGFLESAFKKQRVFEIACGTGYWTQTIAKVCKSIVATDINQEVLAIAQKRDYGIAAVVFEALDFWQLKTGRTKFDGLFGGFIWSHILIEKLPQFLNLLEATIRSEGQIIFMDNKYVAGSSTPIARRDELGNTFQIRKLKDGTQYEVLKNFPSEEAIKTLISPIGWKMEWIELEYFWVLKLKK